MAFKSITKSKSMSSPSYLDGITEEFDEEINNFCKGKKIESVEVKVSQDGTSNWQGGVHILVLNAIIKYDE